MPASSRGIAHYGNCIGIPTIGGEIYFDESYDGNPLVNVFCLGILRHEQIARGAAKGVGNPVFYVGAETGRDGLAGAAFASRDLTEESKQDRPAVQVGDPFREKLLLEACLELLATDAVAGIQDMGAAGLTCSTCETASRGGTGVEIDLAKVPKRETGMTPYEIMLSESQERMLIIVKKGQERKVEEIFEKWDLPYAEVGSVKDDGMMRVRDGEAVAAEIPASNSPTKRRSMTAKPGRSQFPPNSISPRSGEDSAVACHEALLTLLAHPSIASKNWVYRQYDHMVRAGTWSCPAPTPPSSSSARRIKSSPRRATATRSTARSNRAKARASPSPKPRAISPAPAPSPLAVTDNLNFGNPHKPENFWQLRECVEGLAEGCRAFDMPVTGGNVSLYNESPAGAIDPTPTVGMVGLIDDERHVTTSHFKDAGRRDPARRRPRRRTRRLAFPQGHPWPKDGRVPRWISPKKRVQDAVRALIRSRLVKSAHDCSEGGLAVALAECCISNKEHLLGAR